MLLIIRRTICLRLHSHNCNPHLCHFSSFSATTVNKPILISPAVPTPSTPTDDDDDAKLVKNLSTLLREKPNLDSLKKLANRLTADHVIQVLLRSQLEAGYLLEFFSWVGQQKGFRHTVHSYCTMIHILCLARMFPQAHSLIEVIVSRKGRHSASSVFQVLMDTWVSHKNSPPAVYNMLMNTYIQAEMVPDAIQCFRLMRKHNCLISLQSCNALIKSLLKSNSTSAAWEFYTEMLDNGVPLNVYTFNMIIHCLCKEGNIKEACRLFEEIGRRGLLPSVVTFNTLINGHCKKGNVGDAFDLLGVMRKQKN